MMHSARVGICHRNLILFVMLACLSGTMATIPAGAQAPAVPEAAPGIRVAVVLGNGSPVIDEPTAMQTARCLRAFDLYKIGAVNKIIVTGGYTFGYLSEARMMKIALVAFGVPSEDVIEEQMAATTIENSVFSARIFDERKWKKSAVVVTQQFHLPRAAGNFKSDGFEVQDGLAADAAAWPAGFSAVPGLARDPASPDEVTDLIVVYEPYRSQEPMDWPPAALSRRLRHAAALFHAKAAPSVVLFNDPYTRGPVNLAQMMKVALVSLGVPPAGIRAVGRREYRRLADLAIALGDKTATVVTAGAARESLGLDPARRWKTVFVD
jgi:uncharacterized SAM-binding protein YcdF (DUF218 family)